MIMHLAVLKLPKAFIVLFIYEVYLQLREIYSPSARLQLFFFRPKKSKVQDFAKHLPMYF